MAASVRSRSRRRPGGPAGAPGLTTIALLAAGVIGLLVIWQLGATLAALGGDRLAAMKLPFPGDVVEAMVAHAPTLAESAWSTIRGALIGLVVGTIVGFLIGLLMAQARWVEDASYPYIVAAQMIPTVALAPIILGAVRDPEVTKVVVAAYITVFAVSLGTIRGLKSTPGDALELMRTYHASRRQQYTKLRLPAALPHFFAGLKVAAPLAVIGQIVVELAGSKDGLGNLLIETQYYGVSFAHLFWATMLLTLALGLVFAGAAALLERVVSPWQSDFRRS